MRLVAGTRLGHYEIVSYLGGGGMGEVYRAEDTLLGRHVAIKVLHENLAENPELLKRFQKEAKALATLSHPNILELHDFGSEQSVSFAVSELLEGETLKKRILKSPLEWQKAVEIAAAVAEGLAAAHAKGVIHRDIKPENIFLVKHGGIKILDFGLARLQPTVSQQELTVAPTVSDVTQSGIVLGTVPYMSPEQVRGEHADERSDIFSFGCVLYEMLARKRPFSGRNTAETTAAILRDEPPKLSGIPSELERILQHCLEKDPNRRLHSAHDLAFAFKDLLASHSSRATPAQPVRLTRHRLSTVAAVAILLLALTAIGLRDKFLRPPPVKKIESLAVLPLRNLSGDPKQEYFADGMTDELIAKLARISAIRVISRTSVMEYKGAHKSLPQIAKELDVDAIIEGSVLQSSDRVRITAQLIHARTDKHLWAESYERDLSDILSLQNEVATAVAQEIRVKLTPQEEEQFASASKVNPAAYEAYLRGISYTKFARDTEEQMRLGITLLERAIEIDPDFARAYAELSRAHSRMYFVFYDHTHERIAKAKWTVDKAFQIQPDLPEGRIALGYYHYYGFRNYKQALHEFSVAQKAIPNHVDLLLGLAAIQKRQGNLQAALQGNKKVLQLDPRNASAAVELGIVSVMIGAYAEAQRYFDIAISLQPDNSGAYQYKIDAYLKWTGDTKGARTLIAKIPDEGGRKEYLQWVEMLDRNYQAALDLLPLATVTSRTDIGTVRNYENAILAGNCYRLMHKAKARVFYDTARIELEKLLQKDSKNYVLHSWISFAYAGLSRKQEAIREAKTAVELFPISEDAVMGPGAVRDLAIIYVMVGEYEAGLDLIEYLLSIPTALKAPSVPMLRIDPVWDPLRSYARFQKILEHYKDPNPQKIVNLSNASSTPN